MSDYISELLADLHSRPPAFPSAYAAGYDAAVHGADTTNCSFKWFRSVESKDEWERGNRAGREAVRRRPVVVDNEND